MSTCSVEMTFIPIAHPHEITNKDQGKRIIKRVNRFLLSKSFSKRGIWLVAKLDPHHNCYDPKNETYCIEIVPYGMTHWETSWFSGNDWKVLKKILDRLFSFMKSIGFAPSVVKRKEGVDYHLPGGGAHVHIGADLFYRGTKWYGRMERFHRLLIADIMNRPYIKWLFSQWFADLGDWESLSEKEILIGLSPEQLFERGFGSCNVEPRYMASSKNSYLTFEFRMFSMVENANEVRLIVQFVDAWVKSIVKKIYLEDLENRVSEDPVLKESPSKTPRDLSALTLTIRKLRAMKDIRKSRKICQIFIDSLGLKWQDYRRFHDRHYAKRIRFGKMI